MLGGAGLAGVGLGGATNLPAKRVASAEEVSASLPRRILSNCCIATPCARRNLAKRLSPSIKIACVSSLGVSSPSAAASARIALSRGVELVAVDCEFPVPTSFSKTRISDDASWPICFNAAASGYTGSRSRASARCSAPMCPYWRRLASASAMEYRDVHSALNRVSISSSPHSHRPSQSSLPSPFAGDSSRLIHWFLQARSISKALSLQYSVHGFAIFGLDRSADPFA